MTNAIRLPPDTHLGAVHLRVADLPSQVAFYEDVLGLQLLAEDAATGAMGTAEGRPLVVLYGDPLAPRRPVGTTGLFHFALRMPARADLGALVKRVQNAGYAFGGFSDHNVSEAAYLTDPEGNGIELYADRPRDVWHGVEGQVFMTTEPLDVPGLLMAAPGPAPRLPKGTTVGHIHLRVSWLEDSEAFYVGKLGLDVVTRSYPGALFASAGGYHHHVGMNVWDGEGAPRSPEGSLGLVSFELVVPSDEIRATLLGGRPEGSLLDPDGIGVRLTRG
ncbi:MAG: VOC family protein [Longimicrobiales bacterium]|nr:VOC family protein [Longimicrobiales bacterium]